MRTAKTRSNQKLVGQRTPTFGFSLIEVLAVVAITLIIAAIAMPTMSRVIDNSKIRGALGEVSNIAQTCRTQAVKTNVSQHLYFSTTAVPGRVVLYVKNASSLATDPLLTTDPQLWLPPQFAIAAAPTGTNAPTALTGPIMWGSTLTPNSGVDPYFNSRGCRVYRILIPACVVPLRALFITLVTHPAGARDGQRLVSPPLAASKAGSGMAPVGEIDDEHEQETSGPSTF